MNLATLDFSTLPPAAAVIIVCVYLICRVLPDAIGSHPADGPSTQL